MTKEQLEQIKSGYKNIQYLAIERLQYAEKYFTTLLDEIETLQRMIEVNEDS